MTEKHSQNSLNMQLPYSIKERSYKLSQFLLSNGADPNLEIDNTSVLIMAILNNDKRMVELLLKFGANPNMSVYVNELIHLNPLRLSIRHCNKDIVELLLKYGADSELLYTIELYYTSDLKKYEHIIELLLKYGANPNLHNGESALLYTVTYRDLKMTKLLLKYNADPNIEIEITPLLQALSNKDEQMTNLLLQYGANPNVQYNILEDVDEMMENYEFINNTPSIIDNIIRFSHNKYRYHIPLRVRLSPLYRMLEPQLRQEIEHIPIILDKQRKKGLNVQGTIENIKNYLW